jgi:pimeloyl-ACP methyl ester carboxylesterase
METTTSTDATTIAFERQGEGPALVLVTGAFCDRSSSVTLAEVLAADFTVHRYDRRGRGDSGDTPPYAPEREVEDLAAVIEAAGGGAYVFGHSSGAVLSLEAAAAGLPIRKLAVYEPPYIVDDTRSVPPDDFLEQLTELIAADRRGDAAERFLTEAAQMPAEVVGMIKSSPGWAHMEALAPSLLADVALCGPGNVLPTERISSIPIETLVMDGGNSPDWMRHAAEAVAAAVPDSQHLTVEGQDHGVADDVVSPLLIKFFA